jgi:lycopene cyclase domain-containing protein
LSRYLIINLLALSFPLLFCWLPKVKYYRQIPKLLGSFILAGGVYLIWDMMATHNGDWGFNPLYVGRLHILGLPLEEILFFLFIPFSSIFIYENLVCRFSDKKISFPKWLNILLVIACLLAAVIFFHQNYTRTAFIFMVLFFFITLFVDHDMLQSLHFWLFITITYLPFFIVNYFLTAPPVVWYNPEAIWGIRITTIPLEDFFYSFSMLGFYLLVYRLLGRKKEILNMGESRH